MNISSSFNNNNNFLNQNLTFTNSSLEFHLDEALYPDRMDQILPVNTENDFHHCFPNLSRKAQHLFRTIQNWSYLDCSPSQQLLAKIVGCTRKHVNHLLKIFHKLGIIKKHYRHRKTCRYFIRDFLKKIGWGSTRKALLKDHQVTPKVTPYIRSSKKTYYSGGKASKSARERPKPPDWFPKWDEFKAKFPTLAREIYKDPSVWWNLAAFTEAALHTALESLKHFQYIPGHIKSTHTKYLMGALLAIVPRRRQNWSLAGKLKSSRGIKFN